MKSKRPKKSKTALEAPKPARPAGNRRFLWAHAVVLVCLLLGNAGLYYRTVHLDFLSVDDPDYVQNNPYIEKLSAANLKRIMTVPYAANYAPANLLSYSLDVAMGHGKKASVIHLSNVMWHGWVVCMVYALAFTIRGEIATAAAAAVLFLLHPAHVEVVAWISSRKDLVATGFAVPAMTCYLLWRRQSKQNGWWYGASLLCFLVASAGKQSVLLLPGVMLLWDVLVEKRRTFGVIVDKIPFGLITIFFGWMTWHAQPSTNQAASLFALASTELTNLWLLSGLGRYFLYRPAPDPVGISQLARLAVIALAAVGWGVPLLFQFARQPIRTVLGYWVLIQMVPPMLLSFIVPVTDRYLFLPSVGACILLADVAVGLARRFPHARWACWSMLAVLAASWGVKTSNYIQEWRDPRSIWYGVHLKTRNPQVSQFLGEVYENAGDRVHTFVNSGNAIAVSNELDLARAVVSDSARVERLRGEWLGRSNTKTNSVAYRDELWKLAWEQYRESLAHRGTLSAPNLFLNRGRLLISQGKFEQAVPEFQTALAFAQQSTYVVVRQETVTQALRSIGVAYWNMRKYKEGLQWYLKAQAVQKKSGQPWVPTLDQEVETIKSLAAAQP